MAPLLTEAAASTSNRNRTRSLSGASALLTRRLTRNSASPRPTPSKSESVTTKRRATVDAPTSCTQTAHIRIVPNIDNPSRSLIFDIVDRDLEVGSVIKMGRYSERHTNTDCMSFKSKVVSRCHCEVWAEPDGKIYIRDTKSSSGTFLNHIRLSPGGLESRAVQLNDGDIVQLGVDFQGGREEMYRSVKMKFELNRPRRNRPMSFNLTAFQNLRNLRQHHQNQNSVISPSTQSQEPEQTTGEQQNQQINNHCSDNASITETPNKELKGNNTTNVSTSIIHSEALQQQPHSEEMEECCICLYALAPFQALFVSPCSHTYHYKCIRPLLQSHPGFQCPICRTYSDLEASVETDEGLEKSDVIRPKTIAPLPTDSEMGLLSSQNQVLTDEPEELMEQHQSNPADQEPPQVTNSDTVSLDRCPVNLPEAPSSDNNQSTEIISQPEEHPSMQILDSVITSNETTPQQQLKRRERRPSQFMEKLKMVFFEKRKSSSSAIQQQQQLKQRKHNDASNPRQRPLSYPNLLSSGVLDDSETPPMPIRTSTSSRTNDEPSTSSHIPLDLSISRHPTSHLNEINNSYQTDAMITGD